MVRKRSSEFNKISVSLELFIVQGKSALRGIWDTLLYDRSALCQIFRKLWIFQPPASNPSPIQPPLSRNNLTQIIIISGCVCGYVLCECIFRMELSSPSSGRVFLYLRGMEVIMISSCLLQL